MDGCFQDNEKRINALRRRYQRMLNNEELRENRKKPVHRREKEVPNGD